VVSQLCSVGGGAEVGDGGEQRVLPEVIGLPPGNLLQQVRRVGRKAAAQRVRIGGERIEVVTDA